MTITETNTETRTSITADKREIVALLAACKRVAPKRSVLPYVRLEILPRWGMLGLRVSVTDFEVWADFYPGERHPIDIDGETDATASVHLYSLADAIRACPNGPIGLALTGRTIGTDADTVTVTGADEFASDLCGELVDWPNEPAFKADASPFDADAFRRVATVAAPEFDARPIISSVLWGETGELVATDSYRLVTAENRRNGGTYGAPNGPVLIPARVGKLLTGKETGLAVSDDYAEITGPDRRILVRRTVGDFPRWESLFPTEPPATVQVDRKAMIKALKAAGAVRGEQSPLGTSDMPPTRLSVTETRDGLALELRSDKRTVSVTVPAVCSEHEGTCWPNPVGVNAGYLSGVLKAMTGATVTISAVTALKPLTVTDQDRPRHADAVEIAQTRALLMPVRITDA